MEQVPHDVRGIERVRKSRLSQGALLRAEVQGNESGQDDDGLYHQAVRLSCPVSCHRHELQPSCERVALPLFGEEGNGIALQTGEVYHRPCETEPGDCGTFKGDVCQVGTTERINSIIHRKNIVDTQPFEITQNAKNFIGPGISSSDVRNYMRKMEIDQKD